MHSLFTNSWYNIDAKKKRRYKKMKLSLPANISKLRKEHSMTQEQLAEALGVTFASVSKWERGVATP